ncbi:MAG TPA: dihydroxyacetone kinase subunit DhaL [Conexibacter sp.]|nr:dihydroxyacetone kinase subunit DhaL [Conexibacter sp.]
MSWTGTDLAALFGAVEQAMEAHRERLDRLDAVAGDGDHGATMVMGWRTVTAAVGDGAGETPAGVLRTAAAAFASVGGSIGPLWGTALLRAARAVDACEALDAEDGVRAVKAAAAGVAERGRSAEGDKTLIDAIAPATRELSSRIEAGAEPRAALASAAASAAEAAEATAQLAPRRGRARRLADRSLGHVDPGAASAAVIWSVAADALGAR